MRNLNISVVKYVINIKEDRGMYTPNDAAFMAIKLHPVNLRC